MIIVLNWKISRLKFISSILYRLTPTYMFVLLFFDKMTPFLGEGPMWYTLQAGNTCDSYWWTNLLYINNFYPTKFSISVWLKTNVQDSRCCVCLNGDLYLLSAWKKNMPVEAEGHLQREEFRSPDIQTPLPRFKTDRKCSLLWTVYWQFYVYGSYHCFLYSVWAGPGT